MRRQQGTNPLVLVQSHVFGIVDWMEFEGIDGNQNTTDVCVNVTGIEALTQILEKRRFIEICQKKKKYI